MLQEKSFRMTTHPYTHAYVKVIADVSEDGTFYKGLELWSYHTKVISIELPADTGVNTMTVYGLYSRTTARQITWFMRELYLDEITAGLRQLCKNEQDAVIALDRYTTTRCIVVAGDYWNNGRQINWGSYHKECKEAIEKWYW